VIARDAAKPSVERPAAAKRPWAWVRRHDIGEPRDWFGDGSPLDYSSRRQEELLLK
jgi:hypothetical protein